MSEVERERKRERERERESPPEKEKIPFPRNDSIRRPSVKWLINKIFYLAKL